MSPSVSHSFHSQRTEAASSFKENRCVPVGSQIKPLIIHQQRAEHTDSWMTTVSSELLSAYAVSLRFFKQLPCGMPSYAGEKVFANRDLAQAGQPLVISGPTPGAWLSTPHPKPGLLHREIQVFVSKASRNASCLGFQTQDDSLRTGTIGFERLKGHREALRVRGRRAAGATGSQLRVSVTHADRRSGWRAVLQ